MGRIKWKAMRVIAAAMAAGCLLTLTACNGIEDKPGPTVSDNANAVSYTVILDPNGGLFDGSGDKVEVTVKEGTAVDFAAYTPVYEGNTLYGWYLPDGSPWPGARKVTSDVTLRAKWSVTEEEVVYDLTMTIGDESVTMEYDAGVYQATYISSIYGGYAQRKGKYAIYTDELLANIEADDGTQQRVLYVAGSDYLEANGATLFAEFYNDGEFELFYNYYNAGEWTKYHMDTGYWTYAGYTPPFEATPLAEDLIVDGYNMGAPSTHEGWDDSLVGGGGSSAGEEQEEMVTLPGEIIYTADADESETMKANFCDNGVMTIFMTSYNVDVDTAYLWSWDEENGFQLTYKGGTENIAADNGNGTYSFSDEYDNAYTMDLAALLEARPEAETLYTAPAIGSETMTVAFNSDHTACVLYDTSAMGVEGQYVVSAGQWSYSAGDGLKLAMGNRSVELTDTGDGTAQFTVDDNTYAITLAELADTLG